LIGAVLVIALLGSIAVKVIGIVMMHARLVAGP